MLQTSSRLLQGPLKIKRNTNDTATIVPVWHNEMPPKRRRPNAEDSQIDPNAKTPFGNYAKGLTSFNWSPSNNAWQRKITTNAIWATEKMFGIALK